MGDGIKAVDERLSSLDKASFSRIDFSCSTWRPPDPFRQGGTVVTRCSQRRKEQKVHLLLHNRLLG